MKKMMVVAFALALAGAAFASAVGIPWFVDSAPPLCGSPPNSAAVCGTIFLHNNRTDAVVCSIKYFTAVGGDIGPATNNTFVVAPQSSLAFRPVASDPASVAGGLESDAAMAVPNRPSGTVAPNDGKKNGSCAVSWVGSATDIQGVYVQSQTVNQATSSSNSAQVYKVTGYGHLLPPGA